MLTVKDGLSDTPAHANTVFTAGGHPPMPPVIAPLLPDVPVETTVCALKWPYPLALSLAGRSTHVTREDPPVIYRKV